jgi:hypothetical protein
MSKDIPEEFYKVGDKHPVVYRVGDLIKQLEKLPKTLSLEKGVGDGMELVVYNMQFGPYPRLVLRNVEKSS